MTSSGEAPGGEPPGDGAAVLGDVPSELWGPLLRAVRRAVDRVDPSELPPRLRPFARFRPERMAAERPRGAVARALADDPRLRESVGELLDDRSAYTDAATADAARLAQVHGDDAAVAALAARARWADVAVVSAAAAERLASRRRATGEPAPPAAPEGDPLARASAELAAAREERDAQRRRADAAESRARRADKLTASLLTEAAGLREQVQKLREELTSQRRRAQQRGARLQRRIEEAQRRGRVDEDRARRVAGRLEELAADLRGALETGGRTDEPGPDRLAGREPVPRGVAAAEPGRPCRLPPGVTADDPLAVEALLQVQGLEVLVDGYNVTRGEQGRPGLPLAEQRRWLIGLAAGMGARTRRRVTLVFDGTEPQAAPVPTARGVRVLFTRGEQIADERIVELVAATEAPVMVVSSDRQVARQARRLGADVVGSDVFVAAVG